MLSVSHLLPDNPHYYAVLYEKVRFSPRKKGGFACSVFQIRSTDVARRVTSIQPTSLSPIHISISVSSRSWSLSPSLPLLPSALLSYSNPGNGMLLRAPSRFFCHEVKDWAKRNRGAAWVRLVHFVDMAGGASEGSEEGVLANWKKGIPARSWQKC